MLEECAGVDPHILSCMSWPLPCYTYQLLCFDNKAISRSHPAHTECAKCMAVAYLNLQIAMHCRCWVYLHLTGVT